MILEVKKENVSNIPVGLRFKYNETTALYEGQWTCEEEGDNYSLTKESYYSFSPSFYAFNEEIFNQVKLEEKDEKIKTDMGVENSQTQDESKDISDQDKTGHGGIDSTTSDLREKLFGEEMEETSKESKSKGSSIHKSRLISSKRKLKETREKDQ